MTGYTLLGCSGEDDDTAGCDCDANCDSIGTIQGVVSVVSREKLSRSGSRRRMDPPSPPSSSHAPAPSPAALARQASIEGTAALIGVTITQTCV